MAVGGRWWLNLSSIACASIPPPKHIMHPNTMPIAACKKRIFNMAFILVILLSLTQEYFFN
jgi:hypothetical protein